MSMSGHTLGEKIRNEDLRKCKCRSSLESDEREPSKMTLAWSRTEYWKTNKEAKCWNLGDLKWRQGKLINLDGRSGKWYEKLRFRDW